MKPWARFLGVFVLMTFCVPAFSTRPRALGTWTSTGAMAVPRTQHAAMRLADGRVLVAGGITVGATTGTAELYDPSTGTWTTTGSMRTPRSRHTATLLDGNRVLVTGGRFRGASLASAEIYDPATGVWSSVADMRVPRDDHSATLLQDGRVLVTGGVSGGDGGSPAEKTVEIYDPARDTWTVADHMFLARFNHAATLLPDGRVLVTGGFNIGANHVASKDAELYDPAEDRWSQIANMRTPRATHAAVLLADGRVLVAGGWTQPPNVITLTESAEAYDAGTNTWIAMPGLPARRGSLNNQVVLFADGDALAAGGRLDSGVTDTAVRYDAATGLWNDTGAMSVRRSGATAVLLADGRVLVAGGGNAGGVLNSAEIYWP